MFAIGNDELERKPLLGKSKTVKCHICGRRHRLRPAKDSSGKDSYGLMFFNCRKKAYLGALDGHLLFSDVE